MTVAALAPPSSSAPRTSSGPSSPRYPPPVLLSLLLACAPPGATGTTPGDSAAPADTAPPQDTALPADVAALYDPTGTDFLSTPWPSDARTVDGHPDLTGYPNAAEVPLIDTYLETMEAETGFGSNTPVYLAFDGPIDLDLLPDPAASLEAGSPLYLVDLDPDSPEHGSRHPVQWHYTEEATSHEPAHSLAVAPLLGLPLRPATTYGLVVTTDLAEQPAAFAEALSTDAHLAPLRDWLGDSEHVAVATVFTTGDHLASLRLARQWTVAEPPLDLSQSLALHERYSDYDTWTGSYEGPLFQVGERPYTSTGGGLVFDDPTLAREPVLWETMRLSLATPTDLSSPPESGWPVVIFLHGTGGDYLNCCNSNSEAEPGAAFARIGALTIGIELPLHGSRGGDLASEGITHPFNFFNPDSARSILRQGAIDAMVLAHALHEAPPTFTLADGRTVAVDPDHVYLMGHSQGGLSAQLALPFMGGEVDGVISSGGGGAMAVTLLDRTDPFSLEEALTSVLLLDEDETLHELHPVVALVQWLSEVTDPLNTGPWASRRGGLYEGQQPVHFLQFSGTEDPSSPPRGSEVLAAAAGTPVLSPAATAPLVWELAGIGEEAGPLQGNCVAWDGSSVTAALVQGAGEDHGYVYDSAEARGVYQRFVQSAAQGAPQVGW